MYDRPTSTGRTEWGLRILIMQTIEPLGQKETRAPVSSLPPQGYTRSKSFQISMQSGTRSGCASLSISPTSSSCARGRH